MKKKNKTTIIILAILAIFAFSQGGLFKGAVTDDYLQELDSIGEFGVIHCIQSSLIGSEVGVICGDINSQVEDSIMIDILENCEETLANNENRNFIETYKGVKTYSSVSLANTYYFCDEGKVVMTKNIVTSNLHKNYIDTFMVEDIGGTTTQTTSTTTKEWYEGPLLWILIGLVVVLYLFGR